MEKARKAPLPRSDKNTLHDLELVQLDVLSMSTPSLLERSYRLVPIDEFTAKSEVYVFGARYYLLFRRQEIYSEAKCSTEKYLQNYSMGRASKYQNQIQSVLEKVKNVCLKYSAPYMSKINGRAGRLVQALTLRSRVLLSRSELSPQLWAEAIQYGN